MLTAEQMTRPRSAAEFPAGWLDPEPARVAGLAEEQLSAPEAGLALALLRADYARLVTAARASVTAARAGSADPLVYVEAELTRRGGLPPQDTTVPAVLADARAAMMLAGWLPGPVSW